MDDCTLPEWLLEERMDERGELERTLVDDDTVGFELVAVCMHDEGVTVTVTVSFGQLPQSKVLCDANGAAAANPNREERKILECIVQKVAKVKIGLKMVGLKILITGVRNVENDSRKAASERVCRECGMKMN